MKIKAAVVNKMGVAPPYSVSRPVCVEEVELDAPKVGEVLIRIVAAGVCHTDISAINGDRPRPVPLVLGHEAAGVVEELGPGVHDLQRGDHVVLVSVPSCGHCLACRQGTPFPWRLDFHVFWYTGNGYSKASLLCQGVLIDGGRALPK